METIKNSAGADLWAIAVRNGLSPRGKFFVTKFVGDRRIDAIDRYDEEYGTGVYSDLQKKGIAKAVKLYVEKTRPPGRESEE